MGARGSCAISLGALRFSILMLTFMAVPAIRRSRAGRSCARRACGPASTKRLSAGLPAATQLLSVEWRRGVAQQDACLPGSSPAQGHRAQHYRTR